MVKYPNLSGLHHMLNWWTHGTQNHLIVAESIQALAATYKALR